MICSGAEPEMMVFTIGRFQIQSYVLIGKFEIIVQNTVGKFEMERCSPMRQDIGGASFC